MSARRATLIAGAVACLVYANALLNGWAGDDVLVVRDNLRAHSIRSGLAAWFLPYWPPPWEAAGLYRPLTILSYGVDWTIGGGVAALGRNLWVFHATNILLHATATALVVRVALARIPPIGALTAGLVFAVHPVHVEAVSNIVGRAELLTAVGLLGAVLAARRYRLSASDLHARLWLGATLLIVALALLSKEHGAIAIAVIAVDHALDPRPRRRGSALLYLGVAAVTLAWLHVWRSIVGLYVAAGATTAFYGMSAFERWATMLPVQLDVIRLLAWPLDLASDYSQQTITIRTGVTAVAVLGLVVMASVLALGLATARRAPAVAFGILIALGSYAPTSNFFFTSGVVLAERNLYLAVLAPALALGWIVVKNQGRQHQRLMSAAIALALLVFAGRAWTRTPLWRTPQGTIVDESADHPENYRYRIHLALLLVSKNDSARGLAEYLAAETLAERDPFVTLFVVNTAVGLKRYDLAIDHARRAYSLAPGDSRPPRWLVQSQLAAGKNDSAVATALESFRAHPASAAHADTYVMALERGGGARNRRLLAAASLDWLNGRLVQASARLDSLSRPANRPELITCIDFEVSRAVLEALAPAFRVPPRCVSEGSELAKPLPTNG